MLRALLDERGWSVREFARRLAGPDGTAAQVESERRTLARYLGGKHVPKRETTTRLAEVLGVPPETLPSKEDEPRSPRGADLLAQMNDLVGQLTILLGLAGAGEVGRGSVETRLLALEAKVDELPTAEDLGRAVATLQAAIDRLASRDNREAQAEKPAARKGGAQ